MLWVGIASTGVSALAQNKAIKETKKGSKRAIDSQEQMLERLIQLQQPNINLGNQATQRLSQLMFGNNNLPIQSGQTPGINPVADKVMIDPRILGGQNGFTR